jgi:hypothetical protein
MITFFTTPKPFVGHIDVIQRNAIQSWRRVYPGAEIILIGDDPGAAEVCLEFGLVHVKEVKRNRFGTKYLAEVYDRAQEMAQHDLLCHVNCDIMLLEDFRLAVERVAGEQERFLAAGRRWDVDVTAAVDFEWPKWAEELRATVARTNRQRPAQWIDYFVFRKGLYYGKIPEFLIGRPGWDNWLLWFASATGVPVVDMSGAVCAVHQNHDYSYHPDGEKGVWEGEEAQENYRLLEGNRRFHTLENATYLLGPGGLRSNFRRWFVAAKRGFRERSSPLWFQFLDFSRPLRHKIGLRQKVRT